MPAATVLSPLVKGLRPGLPERGKIKIGIKGSMRQSSSGNQFQPPQKLDHFIVTTLERDSTGNFMPDAAIHAQLGPDPKNIPVTLLFDDPTMNFQSCMACYDGKKLACRGDGEQAVVQSTGEVIECPCERSEIDYAKKDKCKFNGVLSVILRDVPVFGGVWKFRTTSYNSVRDIISSMLVIRQATGGVLAGIPLNLVLSPKAVTSPDGKQQTVYVVSLEYAGTAAKLRAAGIEQRKLSVSHRNEMKAIEAEARSLMDAELANEDPQDTIDEFYPDSRPAPAVNIGPEPVEPAYSDVQITDAHEVASGDEEPARGDAVTAPEPATPQATVPEQAAPEQATPQAAAPEQEDIF